MQPPTVSPGLTGTERLARPHPSSPAAPPMAMPLTPSPLHASWYSCDSTSYTGSGPHVSPLVQTVPMEEVVPELVAVLPLRIVRGLRQLVILGSVTRVLRGNAMNEAAGSEIVSDRVVG